MKKSKFTQELTRGSKKDFIDLHMHSQHSDGDLKVRDLIDECCSKGMRAMAITDHDSIEAYEDGREYAASKGIEFIPGVEMSSYLEGSEIHILGYLFDPTNLTLNRTLVDLQEKRETRAKKIVTKLQQHGLEIRYERVKEKAKGASIGRPHIAAVMVEEEYVSHIGEAFDKYLSKDFISEFESEKLKPEQAIQLIAQSGGIPVMAHPFRTQRDDLIESLVSYGLKGIETYCSSIKKADTHKYINLASQYDLICCGGADFHSFQAGAKHGLGSVKVPYSCLESLKSLQNSQ